MKASIIYSLKAPCGHPNGLDWDDGTLWLVCGDKRVFQINPQNGEELYSFQSPGHAGVMYDGTHVWVVESPPPRIFRVNPKDGEVVGFLEPTGPVPIGLAWDGQYIWCAEHHKGVCKIEPSTGNILAQFLSPGDRSHDLAWDGTHLWLVDTNKRMFYQMDSTNGEILDSFPSPNNIEPHGLTWDGESLWFTESGSGGDFIHRLTLHKG